MKNNYTRYSQNNNEKPTPEVVEEPVVETAAETVEETAAEVEEVKKPATVTGVVADCKNLNVRVKPSMVADVTCTIPCGDTVVIDESGSTNDWYKVCTANGAEGFCMKKFIKLES